MAEEEESPPEGSAKKKGLLADWKGMKGWQKAGVLIGGGALVVAVLMYINSQNQPSATATNATNAGLLGGGAGTTASNYPGYGEAYPSFPVPGSSGSVAPVTTGSATPPAFTNIASGEAGTGLLGANTTVYSSGGQLYAMQPGSTGVLLSSVLPTGTKVYGGNQGRVWYQLPGSSTQLLLTSGAGSSVNKGIGITTSVPKSAKTI